MPMKSLPDLMRVGVYLGMFSLCFYYSKVATAWTIRPIPPTTPVKTATKYKNYFAFGSNMLPDTMESLRNIQSYRHATAAILPHHQLVFSGAAAVEPCSRNSGQSVHGVLYELSESDFAIVSATEGVPLAYQWSNVHVLPYVGDAQLAGQTALAEAMDRANDDLDNAGDGDSQWIPAQTLVFSSNIIKGPLGGSSRALPPSKSYLKILQQGAARWNMDQSYQEHLSNIVPSNQQGSEGRLLQLAKLVNPPLSSKR